MKKLVYLLIILLLFLIILLQFINFEHQISRTGYKVDTKSYLYVNCNIPIKRFEIIPDTVATKIGIIKLSDAGFSKNCSEEDAMEILEKEGCALGADFVNILKESLPDNESNCYRCKAVFYKYRK
jgi:hypothetical protein